MRARALGAALSAALLCPAAALAGAQAYEELAASVRDRLSAAIADQSVPELAFRDREEGHKWIMEMSRRWSSESDRKERMSSCAPGAFERSRGDRPKMVPA